LKVEAAPPNAIAIVGAGLAGAHAAQTLRKSGFRGEVTLIGQEPLPPYERPPLSKQVLVEQPLPAPAWVLPQAFYESHGICLLTGRRAVALHRRERLVVELADGETIVADAVLLATGGRARRLPGSPDLPCLHYLRDWGDALRLRDALAPGQRVLVVGSGFVGAEVTASAAGMGCKVQVAEALTEAFPAVVCPLIRARLQAAHLRAGVRLRCGVSVGAVAPRRGGGATVRTSDGEVIEADIVVIGIGMVPSTELAASAGARIDEGIVVDRHYRSSVSGVYAAGDVARVPTAGNGHRRVEHWRSALEQGSAAALAMLGQEPPDLPVAWAWSDQFDQRLEIGGHPQPAQERVHRIVSERERATFHMEGGRLVAVTGLNAPRLVRHAIKLISAGARPDPAQLADPARPLL
jgi:3-phenylpropionate/trans-cinnamate dioxygenase ferredoxin reductase component